MPDAKSSEFQRVARKLGFVMSRQKGSHQRWLHPDGRATTIPVHPSATIGNRLYFDILRQLGIDQKTFDDLK